MNFAIISSSKDSASTNIKHNLLNLINNDKTDNKKIIKVYTLNNSLIHAENIDKKINADFLIFISKHVSKENILSFTVHPIGNWSKAEFGGKANALCPSNSFLLKKLFLELIENGNEKKNYEITLEATHHGPYVEKPAVFIEIGSTEKEWSNKDNGNIVAKSIINAIKKFDSNYANEKWISAIFFGGGHYCRAGNKAMLETKFAIGHVCPKYALEALNGELLMQAINKIEPMPEIALLDWKGLSVNKQKVIGLLEKVEMKYLRL